MQCIKKGHKYKLDNLDDNGKQELQFVDRDHGSDCPGTYNQEVLRVLIDRVRFLDSEVPWPGNKIILKHLRIALVLHESRHLERVVEKEELYPEHVKTDSNGHFTLTYKEGL